MKVIKEKNIMKICLGLLVLIVLILGIVFWVNHQYNSRINYDKIQTENRDELRQEYVNILYRDKQLTRSAVSDAILLKDFKEKEGSFTEGRPEQFIEGIIKSYKIDNQKVDLYINEDIEKVYDVDNLLMVDIENRNTSKLKIVSGKLSTEYNSEINLENKKIYIIVNDLNADNSGNDDVNRDDIFILNN